jgi:hypothetical protein
MPYTYNGNRVIIPRHAELSGAFRSDGGVFGGVIQRILDTIEPWEQGEDPIETFDLPKKIGARAVTLASEEQPVWGINPHHKARRPGPSPFVELERRDPRNSTNLATLELTGTMECPMLTRVYPGDYMPPLPWMMSADKALGGKQACLDYWKSNAYILRDTSRPLELTREAPDWYQQAASITE